MLNFQKEAAEDKNGGNLICMLKKTSASLSTAKVYLHNA